MRTLTLTVFLPTSDGMVHVGGQAGARLISYRFLPMEALCTFLWRMAYQGTWDRSLEVLGGRCATGVLGVGVCGCVCVRRMAGDPGPKLRPSPTLN